MIVDRGTGQGAETQLVEDTQFWVVRPRISGGSVSGLGTLLSGSYIGVGIGKSKKPQREFTGLEVPPVFSTDAPGREFVLQQRRSRFARLSARRSFSGACRSGRSRAMTSTRTARA